jgi:hypothetical protein
MVALFSVSYVDSCSVVNGIIVCIYDGRGYTGPRGNNI